MIKSVCDHVAELFGDKTPERERRLNEQRRREEEMQMEHYRHQDRLAARAEALELARAEITADSVLAKEDARNKHNAAMVEKAIAAVEEARELMVAALTDAGHGLLANKLAAAIRTRSEMATMYLRNQHGGKNG